MLVILITAPSIQEARVQQDMINELLGQDAISPILWVQYVAIRTPTSIVCFSNRIVSSLFESKLCDMVLTDSPIEEALRRMR